MRTLIHYFRNFFCGALIGGVGLISFEVVAQCPNNNTSVGTTINPTCPGTVVGPCVQGGQYTNMNIVAGNTYVISTCGGAFFDTQMTLYNPAGGASLAYNDDFCGLQSQVTWTATYTGTVRILIDRFWCNNSGSCATLTVTCTPPAPPPANDDPCGATALTVGTFCSSTSSTNIPATLTSGIPAPGCGNLNGSSSDVWFSFVAPASGTVTMRSTAGTLTDGAFALYSGVSCSGPFTLIDCDDDSGPGFMPFLTATGLTPGNTYFIRYWGYGSATGTFSICVFNVAGDEPCGPISIPVSTNCSFSTYNNSGATRSALGSPGCGNLAAGSADLWFTFIAPASGMVVIGSQAGTMTNGSMALYSANSCSGTMTLIECDAGDGPGAMPYLAFNDLTPSDTYYLRFWGSGTQTGTFDLCVYGPPNGTDCVYVLNMFDSFGDGWGGSTVGVSINGSAHTNYTMGDGDYALAFIGVDIGDDIELNYTAAGGWQNEITYVLSLDPGVLFSDGPNPSAGVVETHTVDCVPPPAPIEDCRGGITVCGSTTMNSNAQHIGVIRDLDASNRGCLGSNEVQGSWYHFSPSASGTIEMTISPSSAPDDYDFGIWGPFGSLDCGITDAPARCSWAGVSGPTGMQIGAGDNSEGQFGNGWVDALSVTAGEIYLLYVSNYSQTGIDFDLSWTMHGGASLDCTVLPIELFSFTAEQNVDQVDVRWATASEHESDRFEVQRSADGVEFNTIGTIQAAGSSSQLTEYALVDHQPRPGMNYYRLEQLDVDGSSSYSNIVPVDLKHHALSAKPYPIPADSELIVPLTSAVEDNYLLEVLDARGKVVDKQDLKVLEGTMKLRLSTDGLKNGSYTLRAIPQVSDAAKTFRFVVQH